LSAARRFSSALYLAREFLAVHGLAGRSGAQAAGQEISVPRKVRPLSGPVKCRNSMLVSRSTPSTSMRNIEPEESLRRISPRSRPFQLSTPISLDTPLVSGQIFLPLGVMVRLDRRIPLSVSQNGAAEADETRDELVMR